MADPIPTKPAGSTPPSGAAPAVAGNGNAVALGPVATTPHASATAAKHGGLRGGKKRDDGLVPGSPEALEADKKKDAERKRKEREEAKRATDPAPIPPVGSPQAQAGAVGAVPGAQGSPAVPWDPKMLEPLFQQLIPTAEKISLKQITSRAKKANLPKGIVDDIERDAAWNDMAKKAISISAPQVAAKWLNKTGVSAEHQPEIVLGTALCSIVAGHVMLMKRLNELIEKSNPPIDPPKNERPTELIGKVVTPKP